LFSGLILPLRSRRLSSKSQAINLIIAVTSLPKKRGG
jgi:hypothetical protein